MSFHVPNQYRIRAGLPPHMQRANTDAAGNNGAFAIPYNECAAKRMLCVIASAGLGWEHVSVHIEGASRCPSWGAMCFIKSLFWDDRDWVVQFHPPVIEYINNHPYTLHLWRPTEQRLPTPPNWMV